VGTIFTFFMVAIEHVLGGVQLATLREIVPLRPEPQITVAVLLPAEGTGLNTPPVTDQLYVEQIAEVS
jgi:hypothetical protein